jgi:hypothetical protein
MHDMLAKQRTERGQTAVLFALMIVGLVLFVGLAVDGGNIFNERRITQNAADSAALSGVHYMVGSDAPSETALQRVINDVVEANGLPDTDGIPRNEINGNVAIFYTDSNGNRLVTQPCWQVPCGSIPLPARGLEVDLQNPAETYFLGLIDRDTVNIGAEAVAVTRGGTGGGDAGDNVLVAFGDCDEGDRPLDLSTWNTDFIGGLHSDTYFENRGELNHYHGQVTYVEGYVDSQAGTVKAATYEPDPPGAPQAAAIIGDPFAGLFTVADFSCSGTIGSTVTCYDLETLAAANGGVVTTQLLKNNSPGSGPNYLTQTGPHEWQLRPGLYYAGAYPFDFGERGMKGTVTLVSNSYIKLTEDDLQLTGYMPAGTVAPGLLMYSGLDAGAKKCTNHEDLTEWEEPINTTGNSGSTAPGVYHNDDKPGCVDLGSPSDCYELGSLQYIGLIYAPGGRVSTSGNGASYVGAIVAYSIRINGSQNRSEGGGTKPDKVGALFVSDPNLFPQTDQLIYLER